MTIRWADENMSTHWLKTLNPEAPVSLMFGTNDLNALGRRRIRNETPRRRFQKCLDNGAVVILNTIPPRHGQGGEGRRVRRRRIGKRRPRIESAADRLPGRDSQTASRRIGTERWTSSPTTQGYDVPTLIARDGVHPSNSKKQFSGDFSDCGTQE
jgi:hypothetical protein